MSDNRDVQPSLAERRGGGLTTRVVGAGSAFGRVRQAPAGETRIMPFDPAVPSLILSAGLVALVLVSATALFDAISVPWQRQLPYAVVAFFQGVTDFGKSDWELIPCGVLLLVLAAGDWRQEDLINRLFWQQVSRMAAYIFAAVALSGIFVNLVKVLIGRARPANFDNLGPFAFEPFSVGYQFASFPSGHSTTVGAVVVAFGLMAPNWRPHILATGLIVAFSRVLVGAHYPSDVAGGFLIGGLFAYAIGSRLADFGFGFSRSRDDTIRTRTAVFGRVLARPGGVASALAGPWRALVRRFMPSS